MATKRNILYTLLQKRLGFSPQEAFLSLPKWHYWWEMASTISSIITENIFGQRERTIATSALSSIMDVVQLLKAQQLHFRPLTDWFYFFEFPWTRKSPILWLLRPFFSPRRMLCSSLWLCAVNWGKTEQKKAKSKLSNRSFDTFRFKGIVFMSIFLKILISVASQTPDRQQSLKWRLQKNPHQQ